MKILNLYFSSTGNTEKVAARIGDTAQALGHSLDTVKITDKDVKMDILKYDMIFVGSGVYAQLPGNALIDLFRAQIQKYAKAGVITAGDRGGLRLIVWCIVHMAVPIRVFTRPFPRSSIWASCSTIWDIRS